MKLTVRFGDEDCCILEILHAGVKSPPTYRTVVIKLTPEQTVKLKRRVLERRENGKAYMESREVIALED